VETPNYCPHCGAALTPVTEDRLYTRWLRPALVFVGAATLVVVSLVASLALLLVLLVSLLPENNSGLCDTCTVTFHNKTDELLCTYPGCDTPSGSHIEPRGKSEFLLDSCNGQYEVTVYTPSGRKLYSKVAGCYEWDDGFILINYRDGEFVVADSLDPPTPTPYAPP